VSPIATASLPSIFSFFGQVSIDEEGKLVGAGDLAAQTTKAMKNLGLALEAAGATFADIVKTTTFVVNYRPALRTVITDAKKPFWAGKPPTSVLIGVASLASARQVRCNLYSITTNQAAISAQRPDMKGLLFRNEVVDAVYKDVSAF
jgi:enamine deaminase RidA (YjgF/YER057c/UK114 family)